MIWPNRTASRFVFCPPTTAGIFRKWGKLMRRACSCSMALGGQPHSWRDLMPALAEQYRVVALDLPGHGFTRLGTKQRSGLAHTADDIRALAGQEGWRIDALVGHSAGAALALKLWQVLDPAPGAVIGLNAALEGFPGPAEWAFPIMAKMLALNPVVPMLFAGTAGTTAAVRNLIASTGSHLDDEGIALYRAAISDADHVDGALSMMAQWDLDALQASLPDITARVLLITGENDRAVPPATSIRAADRLPNASLLSLPGLGHLAHEEAPVRVAAHIAAFVESAHTVQPA